MYLRQPVWRPFPKEEEIEREKIVDDRKEKK
jgi:hypothetical protein